MGMSEGNGAELGREHRDRARQCPLGTVQSEVLT